uniref:Uncharacterized protein n=1 Tax=Xiphophorus couchianus TaxID=32473 RepID=A0A3B5MAZ0_9TELE
MDQMTFKHDTVLSDVHMHRPNTHHLMTRLNSAGQPGYALLFKCIHVEQTTQMTKYCLTEHTMATPLEDVGKQVWRGALLLADFILSEKDTFSGATVLELGAGTGLTSIVMATTAKTVYCTDVGEDLLRLCHRNVFLNQHMTKPADADLEFSWTEEEVADLYDNAAFIIATDVCYDDDLTDGLFRTLKTVYHCFFLNSSRDIRFTTFSSKCSTTISSSKCKAVSHKIHWLLWLLRKAPLSPTFYSYKPF